jgi:hypothetical protein
MKSATTDRERASSFTTISGRPIERLYTADSISGLSYDRDLGDPGVYPYTRGIHPTGYRGKVWTMRQFAGFGTPEETNGRYKQLLAAGGTGLSVAFDLPTLMGRDPDDPLSLGEVGSAACRWSRWPTWNGCSTGSAGGHHDLDDDQLAGADDLRDVPGRRGAAGRRLEDAVGHDSERHPQRVHRAEGIHFPAAPVDAADHGHLRVLRGRSAEVEHDLGERVSHSRGRIDRAAGTGLHPA